MEKYIEYFTDKSLQVTIDECGVEQYPGFSKHEYTVRRYFAIHYIESGMGYYEVNGEKYTLKAGDAFILRKNEKVRYYSESKNPWKYYWVAISGEQLNVVLETTTLINSHVVHFGDDNTCAKILKEIVRYNQENTSNHLINLWNHSKLYEFLYHLNIEFRTHKSIYLSYIGQKGLADVIIDYIYRHYNEDLTVEDIANRFNISRSHLYKLCKNNYDKAPKEIILELRLNNAQQLLLETDYPIKEIARQIGFNNQLYFSRKFKASFGYSPSEYRKLKSEDLYY